MKLSGVYLLHFDKKIKYSLSSSYGDERHYVGASQDIFARVEQHQQGLGSKMTAIAKKQGLVITLAAIFPGDMFSMEQFLTGLGPSTLCPLCLTSDNKIYGWMIDQKLHQVPYKEEKTLKGNKSFKPPRPKQRSAKDVAKSRKQNIQKFLSSSEWVSFQNEQKRQEALRRQARNGL